MKVGHGRAFLEVPDGTVLGGYADRQAASAGQHDMLEVNAVILQDDTGARFGLIACDVVCVNADLTALCAEALSGLGVNHMWLSAGHTHSGPDTGCVPGGTQTPPQWLPRIEEVVRQSANSALQRLETAFGEHHRVMVADVGGVRSAPANLIDLPFDAIAVYDDARQLTGVIVVLPIHPTVLPPQNLSVSADLLGGVRRNLRNATGAWITAVTGAAGDISTRYGRKARSIAEVHRLAELISEPILKALRDDADPLWTATDELVERRRVVPVRPMHSNLRGELLGRFPDSGNSRQLRHVTASPDRTTSSAPAAIEVATLRAGKLVLGAVPGEPFLASGAEFAAAGGTALLGYTNGYVGYLPTCDRFTDPVYEVLVTRYEPGTAERLVEAMVDLVHGRPV